jgi:hypothetical protein
MKKLLATLFLLLTVWPAWGQAPEIMRPVTSHTLAIDGTSTAISTGFGPYITVVRVHPTVDAWVAFGNSSVSAVTVASQALTAAWFMPADLTEFFRVSPGQFLAVISNGSDGTIYVVEMTR